MIDTGLAAWLEDAAPALDTGAADPAALLPRLAAAGLPGIGVPEPFGGSGGDVTDAVESIAAVSFHSMTAGLALWGHRTFIDYLLQTPNQALRRHLPDLVAGRVAGATGMSNAMKFLSGLEGLQITARPDADGHRLDGKLPWVTNLRAPDLRAPNLSAPNLRAQGFLVAAAVASADPARPSFCAALPHDLPGLARSPDLDLMALRSSSTAALTLSDVRIGPEHILHDNAVAWLPAIRPSFLGLQCGLSLGLARRSLAQARLHTGAGRTVLDEPIATLAQSLQDHERELRAGLRNGLFRSQPAPLFRLRIGLADIVAEAVSLELQAAGGRAYLNEPGRAVARRLREAAFVPLITPSLVQLKAALSAQPAGCAA